MDLPKKSVAITLAILAVLLLGYFLYDYIFNYRIIELPRPLPPSPEETYSFPVMFLGNEIKLDPARQNKSAEMFLSLTQRSPETYGIITLDLATNNVRNAAQITAIGLANFSIIDLACESIVDTQRSCDTIDAAYNKTRAGFPDQQQFFPPSEGYNCRAIRDLTSKLQDQVCPRPVGAQQSYLCKALQTKDCRRMYTELIEDYTYTGLGTSTGERGFCELVNEPLLKTGCMNADKDTVKKDVEIGVEGS